MTSPRSGQEPVGCQAPATAPSTALSQSEFKALYATHWPAIVDYLRFRVGPGEAADLAADTFTQAWASRTQYDPARGEPASWIWGIARNVSRAWHRRGGRAEAGLSEGLASDVDLESGASRVELQAMVAKALGRLSPLDQEILALRFGGGLSHRDIGRLVGLAEAAAGQRLHRSVRQLRQILERTPQ